MKVTPVQVAMMLLCGKELPGDPHREFDERLKTGLEMMKQASSISPKLTHKTLERSPLRTSFTTIGLSLSPSRSNRLGRVSSRGVLPAVSVASALTLPSPSSRA